MNGCSFLSRMNHLPFIIVRYFRYVHCLVLRGWTKETVDIRRNIWFYRPSRSHVVTVKVMSLNQSLYGKLVISLQQLFLKDSTNAVFTLAVGKFCMYQCLWKWLQVTAFVCAIANGIFLCTIAIDNFYVHYSKWNHLL